jgi:hypothetical protein
MRQMETASGSAEAQIFSDRGEISKVAQLHGGFYWSANPTIAARTK